MEVRRPRRAGVLENVARIVFGFKSKLIVVILTSGGGGRAGREYLRMVRVWGRSRVPPPAGALSLGNSSVFASRETRKPLGKSAPFGADR